MSQTLRRTPSGLERALIVALAFYAVAVVSLDTFRPFLHGAPSDPWPLRWYPIATLGFEADNNGRVVSVDADGPAAARGLRPGQQIDLASVTPDRRAINIFVYVAHGSAYGMRVIAGPGAPFEVTIPAKDESLDRWNATALLIAQGAALFFIALCVYLVWHSATWSTWGFFLYGTWFNSGQYFVWYANLPRAGLAVFDALQAVMQALALTGFVAFAMHFPEEEAPLWTRAHRSYVLAALFLVLFVTGAWGFLNFVFDWRTELPYRIYFTCTFVAYFLALSFFLRNFRRLPAQRPRMRWIMAAGLVGLPCFLLADVYEATGVFRHLPSADAWVDEHQWVLNLLYATNVLLPAAVVYTARRYEVMSVRFGITRAVVLSTVFVLCAAALDYLAKLPIEGFMAERDALRPFALPFSFLLAVGLASIHNPLHGMVERVCAPRWHRARHALQALAQRLVEDDAVTMAEVDRALVEEVTTALWLTGAALFRRQAEDVFALQAQFNWPQPAALTLRADHPWLREVGTGPVAVADPDEAPGQPGLAVPVRCIVRQPAPRLVLYGHHVTRERIDPDEFRVLADVARAAALAYMRLEYEPPLEQAGAAPATDQASERSSRAP